MTRKNDEDNVYDVLKEEGLFDANPIFPLLSKCSWCGQPIFKVKDEPCPFCNTIQR